MTTIADILQPDEWLPYMQEQTKVKSALWSSGIVYESPELTEAAQGSGSITSSPFFRDLDSSNDSEILDDAGGGLTPDKIDGTGLQVMIKHFRGKSWKSSDLAAELAGSDPAGAIASRVAEWWARDLQKTLIASLTGAFEAMITAGYPHTVNLALETTVGVTDDNLISGPNIIKGFKALGDAGDDLTAIAMHSVPYWSLVEKDLIEFVATSEQTARIPRFFDRPVIVDDSLPVVPGTTSGFKYHCYLFGPRVIGWGEGNPKMPVETDRDILKGIEYLVNRRSFVLHPGGFKWRGTPVKLSPSNVELRNGANWLPVLEPKNIQLVRLIVNG